MPPPHRYINNNFTYVSSCTKYLIFLLNFMFWLFGGLLIGIGLYSGLDKFQATGLIKLDTYYDILLNISIVMVLSGGIVFIVSFCGCLGELEHDMKPLQATNHFYFRRPPREHLPSQVLLAVSAHLLSL